MTNPILYCKRIIPEEKILLKDDTIIECNEEMIITKWNTLKPRDDFHHGYSIYYLALLIVECVLMGATIDYGILFTGYYRENRKHLDSRGALEAAYNGSIHSIMTSGLILILVTGVFGYLYSDPTVAEICRTISMGALSAVLVILLLPGILSALDRLIVRRKQLCSGEKH